jgi:histidinol dehydrogenase
MRILSGDAAERRVRQWEIRCSEFQSLEPAVGKIIADVRKNGDHALRAYAEKWDGLELRQSLRVAPAELDAAWAMSDPRLKSALRLAAARIQRFCNWQRPRAWSRTLGGITTGQVLRPLESVGCYVPGGRHPLVSTLLMTAIPAQVAGVRTIQVVSPDPKREVLAAAHLLGVQEFYRVGGAQAVAALAYGTKTVPRVDKIVGPGNAYVTVAKKLVSFDCAIDLLAGPTEALILSDRGRSDFIAADLVAQAEHDPEAISIFVTTSKQLARAVSKAATKCAHDNPVARQSLTRKGAVLVAASREQAIEWANRIAPEHITVEARHLPHIRNAGSIFVGDYSAQAAGDYASGPNHVLPTGGVARFRGGLSVNDFLKVITVQDLTRKGLARISPSVVHLAEVEGLAAHAQSIRVRCSRA